MRRGLNLTYINLNFKCAVSSLASFLGDNITSIDNTELDVNEFQWYSEAKITEYVNGLDWWKLKKNTFPNFANLARPYCFIQAISVSSEWLFSAAGQIISERRPALSSDTSRHCRQTFFFQQEHENCLDWISYTLDKLLAA